MNEHPSSDPKSSSDDKPAPKAQPDKVETGKEAEAPTPLAIRPRYLGPKREEETTEEEGKEKASRPKPSVRPFQPRGQVRDKEKEIEEDDKPSESEEEELENERTFNQSASRSQPSLFKPILRARVPLVPAFLLLLALVVAAALWSFGNGVEEGKRQAEAAALLPAEEIPPEVRAKLDTAMNDLRNQRTEEGLQILSGLESTTTYPSLSYLVGLAALQKGDLDLVERKARESIRKQEKISDSYALLAVVESQRGGDKTRVKMGSTIKRAQALLAQAIAADPANPYPRFELATLLRYDRRKEEAAKELNGAQFLLNPIDSHFIMDITAKIMALEVMPVDQLPKTSEPSDNPQKLIPAAYAAMRLGDFARAATLLKTARAGLSLESFDYLVNDPAMRRFSREPALVEFYQ